MGLFYFCPHCEKKYQKDHTFTRHVQSAHNVEGEVELPEMKEYQKNSQVPRPPRPPREPRVTNQQRKAREEAKKKKELDDLRESIRKDVHEELKQEYLNDDNECKICVDAVINAVVLPCGHMHMCLDCAQEQKRLGRGCPMCRGPIREVNKVFK